MLNTKFKSLSSVQQQPTTALAVQDNDDCSKHVNDAADDDNDVTDVNVGDILCADKFDNTWLMLYFDILFQVFFLCHFVFLCYKRVHNMQQKCLFKINF